MFCCFAKGKFLYHHRYISFLLFGPDFTFSVNSNHLNVKRCATWQAQFNVCLNVVFLCKNKKLRRHYIVSWIYQHYCLLYFIPIYLPQAKQRDNSFPVLGLNFCIGIGPSFFFLDFAFLCEPEVLLIYGDWHKSQLKAWPEKYQFEIQLYIVQISDNSRERTKCIWIIVYMNYGCFLSDYVTNALVSFSSRWNEWAILSK